MKQADIINFDTNKYLTQENIIEYMNWLENYINNENSFISTYMPRLSTTTPNFDTITNISRLKRLFEITQEYSKKNNIYATTNNLGIYYTIEYNDIGYSIGRFTQIEIPYLESTKKKNFFCMRTTLDIKENYIKFSDLFPNINTQNRIETKEKLQELATLIEILAKHNIPLDTILETTNDTIAKIKKKQLNRSNQNK